MIEQRGKFWINFLQILYISLFCADPSPQMSPEAFTTYLACQTRCHFVFLNLKTEKKVDGIFVSSPEEEWGSKSRLFFIHLWNNDRPVVLFSSFFYILHVLPLREKLNTKHHPAPYSTTTLYHISWGVDAPDDDTLLKFFIGVFELV